MSAQVFILPIIPRRSFDDPAWCEQNDREAIARRDMTEHAPPRTRALLVVRNDLPPRNAGPGRFDRCKFDDVARVTKPHPDLAKFNPFFDVRAQFNHDLSVLRDAFNGLPEG